ncbi:MULTISPECIES: hypothetical protein [Microbacterium]|uniref:hypothetical protein n=1 Tax=Microbacterium TaxID=33882 RepID=UPI00146F6389|nr:MULTISPECIES: hypothetical protein [Microbacterium]
MTDELSAADKSAREMARRAADREYKREWRRRNAERIREYRAVYDAANRDRVLAQKREYMRGRNARLRRRKGQLERRRVYSRKYYAENRDTYLDYQRSARARRKAENPERFLRLSRESQRRWRESNRPQVNRWQRERYEADPVAGRERSARYYAENRDAVLAKRRLRWAENREQSLVKQRAYRARERRRRELGLPPRRIHRVRAAERHANEQAAQDFFTRERTPAEIAAIRGDAPTDPSDLARWGRDSARARAGSYLADLAASRARAEEHAPPKTVAMLAREAEEARMEEIARHINDRLRRHPRRPDTADAPLYSNPPHTSGLGR